jgi:protocatechuate 3,4-dioxygenase beta subunit
MQQQADSGEATRSGRSIRGKVVDLHGTPVAGARVIAAWPKPGYTLSERPCPESLMKILEPPDFWAKTLAECLPVTADLVRELVSAGEGDSPVHAEATSDAEGAFLLEGLPVGPQILWALGEHGAAERRGIPAGAENVELVLTEGYVLSGTVMGEGAPIAGVRVTALGSYGATRFFHATTGADGAYRIGPLPQNRYFLFASKDGWHPQLVESQVDRRQQPEETVTLHRPSRVSGRVLLQGAPVQGAEVRVTSHGEGPDDLSRGLTTDAEGRFSLVLPSAAHLLSAAHDGQYALVRVVPKAPSSEVVLELSSASHVEGIVSEAGTGKPVAGVAVKMVISARSALHLWTRTDARGRFRLGPTNVNHYPSRFTLEAPGYYGQQSVEPLSPRGHNGPLEFTLHRAASITGRVTDTGGRPVRGIKLSLVPAPKGRAGRKAAKEDEYPLEDAWTDAEGRFVINADSPGDYLINVRDAHFLDTSFRVSAPAKDVQLSLSPGASVAGTVVDSRGLPLAGWLVEVLPPEEGATGRLRSGGTDATGRFLLQGIAPGRYRLRASEESPGIKHRVWRTVEVTAGTRAEVELRMPPERTLSGLVLDDAGQPLKEAKVWVVPRDMPDDRPSPMPVGKDGRFTLRGLTEPEYDVCVYGWDHDFAPERSKGGVPAEDSLRIGAETQEVRLILVHKPRIVGRLVDPDGAPIPSFSINHFPGTDPGGVFTISREDAEYGTLHLAAEGFCEREIYLELPAEGEDVDAGVVQLSRDPNVHVEVVDAETSEPVHRPSIEPYIQGCSFPGDGFLEIPRAALESSSSLTVAADGYLDQPLIVAPGQARVTVRMSRGAFVEVTVKDRHGRFRAANVEFEAEGSTRPPLVCFASQGQLLQRGLNPGTYTVRLSAEHRKEHEFPHFLPQRVEVPASGDLQVAFTEAVEGAR